jgi:hypothetical protein
MTPNPDEPHAGAASGASAPGDQLWAALCLGDQPPRAPHGGLPVAHLASPTLVSSTHYTVTAIDGRGRLADRSPLRVLQWPPGFPVAVSVVQGAVVVVPSRKGREVITRQGHLRLPAAVRHLCRLKAGDRLLLAACPDRSLLLAYTMAALDAMVLAYHATLHREVAQ